MSLIRPLEFAIALFGLFFMSGTLTAFLTPLGSDNAPLVQLVSALLGLYALVGLFAQRHAFGRIVALYWPVLLPMGLAILTLAWSEDIWLSLRRAGSLFLTTAFAFWIVSRFTPQQMFKLLIAMSVSIILVNYLVIHIQPTRGIHQPYEFQASQHAGSWRGLFAHKNNFGRVVALANSFLVIAFLFSVGGAWKRWLFVPIMFIAAVMISHTNSSQAVMLAFTVPATIVVLLAMRHLTPSGRAMTLFVSLPFVVMSVYSAQLLFEYVLRLLDRDVTLTGRTEIWEGVILSMREYVLLGGGYGAGWQIVGPRLTALTSIDVGHAHNGFLDLAVDVGFIGLALTLMFLIWLGLLAFKCLMNGQRTEIAIVALALVAYILAGNWVGSFLLKHNSIFWVLPIVTFAMLRDIPFADHALYRKRAMRRSDRGERILLPGPTWT